jgi:arylsulfatase
VLAALDRQGLADNTIVVFLSDHGDMMGDHGLHNKGPFHFQGLLRVPMIWRWPGRIPAGERAGLASLLDFVPTLLDFTGAEMPEGPCSPESPMQRPTLPGRSLVPMLGGQADGVQDSVLVENDEDYLGLNLRTLITATHRITTYTGDRGAEPYGELFDLHNDPHELHNLWSQPDCQNLKRDLIVELHHRLVETDSSLPRRLGHA